MIILDRLARAMPLRLRIFLFFALAAIAGIAVVGLSAIAVFSPAAGEPARLALRAVVLSAFGIAAIMAAIWYLFDTHIGRPVERLGRFANAAAHAGGLSATSVPQAMYLGYLAPAIRDLSLALDAARADRDTAVSAAIVRAEQQKARLEAVLNDLHDGILICNRDDEIVLYNPRAVEILRDVGTVGLRRSVFDMLSPGPVRHSRALLLKRLREGRHVGHTDALSLPFAALCTDGQTTIEAVMTLALAPGGSRADGYVLSFSDQTERLAASAEAERKLIGLAEKIREEASSMHLLGELLKAEVPAGDRAKDLIGALMAEVGTLSESADQLDSLASDQLARSWPMGTVLATTLFSLAGERSRLAEPPVAIADPSTTIHCDSAAIAALLARLSEWVAQSGRANLSLSAHIEEGVGFVDLGWSGEPLTIREINDWLATALDHDLGPVTAADVLARHASDLWSEASGKGAARLRMPLNMRDASRMRAQPLHLPERRQFYDFDIFTERLPADLAETSLDMLTAVVFDTETTGLEPSRGDQMVSIAGVRLVNGRILEAEIFNEFVDPGRPIPPASTRIHGITDEMVAQAGTPPEVVARFHAFARHAVLIAHNAPFDMKFLSMAGRPADIRFTNPVLDTVLLAAHLHGAEDSLTLDRLAEIYDVALPEEVRHTAHGDALATAGVFLRLLGPLGAIGVRTLGEAIRVSEAQAALRRKQMRR